MHLMKVEKLTSNCLGSLERNGISYISIVTTCSTLCFLILSTVDELKSQRIQNNDSRVIVLSIKVQLYFNRETIIREVTRLIRCDKLPS